MTKKELRSIYKEKRNAISPEEKLNWDLLLLKQLQQLNFSGTQSLLSYWPLANMNEPNIHLFTDWFRNSIPGLKLAYPVTDFEAGGMTAVLVNEDTIYHTPFYSI